MLLEYTSTECCMGDIATTEGGNKQTALHPEGLYGPRPKTRIQLRLETTRAARHANHQILALNHLRKEVPKDDAPQEPEVA